RRVDAARGGALERGVRPARQGVGGRRLTQKQTSDLEMYVERTFRASPEKVFDAWTDPAKLAKWFGPDGFTTTTHEMDLRPGGTWRHTMVGPDGKQYPNEIRFVEIDRPRKLVYD